MVTDPSGAAVPDAHVSGHSGDHRQRAQRQHRFTGGRYRIPALPVGTYTVRCQKPGFQDSEIRHAALSLNQTLQQSIHLSLAAAGTSIDVHEQPEALNTTAVTAGVGIGGEVLEETPSQNRSYLGVVLLAPGLAPAARSNALRTKAGVRSAAPDSGFTFAGIRPRNNSLSIDGLDNRDETTGSTRVAIGQEAVAEFRVAASDVAPESGGAAGGNLDVVTLSGTNRFHGDVNLFAADSFLEARSPEADTTARPNRRQYQPEAALNGPLQRDRTFFAATIEGELESAPGILGNRRTGALRRINERSAVVRYSLEVSVRSLSEGLFPTASSSTETSFKLTHLIGDSASGHRSLRVFRCQHLT